MANSERRRVDKQGRTFIPINVDGNINEHKFINITKLMTMGGLVVFLAAYISNGKSSGYTWIGWLLTAVAMVLVYQYIIRKVILEEDYYYKIWKKQLLVKNSKPDIAWTVSSIRKTNEGDILIYSDLKIACLVRLERDTIVGRETGSQEKHIDAWSDFYKELNTKDLEFVQLNIMEPAGKDTRLSLLSETAAQCDNKNIREALELETGWIKSISTATLNESDLILIYTPRISRLDSFLSDVTDCCYKLLEGAYRSAEILDDRDIYQMPKELNNVGMFDGIGAQMNVYKNSGFKVDSAFEIVEIELNEKKESKADGLFGGASNKVIKLDKEKQNIINKLASLVNSGYLKYGDWTVKSALNGELGIKEINIEINNYSEEDLNKNATVTVKSNKKHNVLVSSRKLKSKEPKKVDEYGLDDDDFFNNLGLNKTGSTDEVDLFEELDGTDGTDGTEDFSNVVSEDLEDDGKDLFDD